MSSFGARLRKLAVVVAVTACKSNSPSAAVKADDEAAKPAQASPRSGIDYHDMVVDDVGNILVQATATGEIDKASETALSLADDTSKYAKLCAAQSVPTPPDWGDKRWQLQGQMDGEMLFAGENSRTELWTYTENLGVCAALPRYNGSNIFAFGVICANPTGQTCFYDNAPLTPNAAPLAVKDGYKIASRSSGADTLATNCTMCHRGDNPWIVVPGEVTARLPSRYPLKPVGPTTWDNPPGNGKPEACNQCHSIPRLNRSYCDIATKMITHKKRFMPPDGGTDGVDEFKALCGKLMACLDLASNAAERAACETAQ